jgi:hypothetical protein
MNDDPAIALTEVHDLATLLAFMRVLAADFSAANAMEEQAPTGPWEPMHGWENARLDAFLEAAVAWGATNRFSEPARGNPFRQIAEILAAGKGYE